MKNHPRGTQGYLIDLENTLDDISDLDWLLNEYRFAHAEPFLIPAIDRGVNPVTAIQRELFRHGIIQ